MQISALKKLLQLIKNSESLEEVKSSEATSEQETENNLADVDEETLETETQSEEMQSEEMQNAECGMQNKETTVNHTENNRSHLTSSVPRAAKAPLGTLTKGELAEIRALFTNLDDTEIQRLYKKVTK